jgi:hypothetical protein
MNGIVMYDLAQLEMTERHQRAARYRLARAAVRAEREQRALAGRRGLAGWLGRRAGGRAAVPATAEVTVPAIPDYAHEMFGPAPAAVPGQRTETVPGRSAGTGR